MQRNQKAKREENPIVKIKFYFHINKSNEKEKKTNLKI